MQADPELKGACHCGDVRLTLPSRPPKATRCNCSLCRRVGAVWAYYEFGTVTIRAILKIPTATCRATDAAHRALQDLRRRHALGTAGAQFRQPHHGVNLNNFDPALLAQVEVRQFDGADTWTFLDEGAA